MSEMVKSKIADLRSHGRMEKINLAGARHAGHPRFYAARFCPKKPTAELLQIFDVVILQKPAQPPPAPLLSRPVRATAQSAVNAGIGKKNIADLICCSFQGEQPTLR